MNRAGVAQAARGLGLRHWADAIAREALPSGRLVLLDADADGAGTRLGGQPLLPPDFEWPTSDRTSLAFIGQIGLDDLPTDPKVIDVPPTGMLSFFYDATGQPWGFDPADTGRWSVLWFADPAGLVPHPFPNDLGPDFRFRGVRARVEPEWTIPDPWSVAWERLGVGHDPMALPDDELHAYDELAERLVRVGPRHRIGGHPDQVQFQDLLAQADLVSSGVHMGEAVKPEDRARGAANASRWQLLLQVDTDGTIGTEWGDTGRIFFMSPRSRALEADFQPVWLVLQCG